MIKFKFKFEKSKTTKQKTMNELAEEATKALKAKIDSWKGTEGELSRLRYIDGISTAIETIEAIQKKLMEQNGKPKKRHPTEQEWHRYAEELGVWLKTDFKGDEMAKNMALPNKPGYYRANND